MNGGADMGKRSRVYKVRDKLFQYDFDECMVYWVSKPNKDILEDNEEWMSKHGHPLFPINDDGYMDVTDGVGLAKSNWQDKEARNEYLEMWCDELDEESAILLKQYEMWG